MNIIPLESGLLPQLQEIALAAHRAEQQRVPALNEADEGRLTKALAGLLSAPCGVAAMERGRVVGYLAFYPPQAGKQSGVTAYSPAFANGAARWMDRAKVNCYLFTAAAERLLSQGVDRYEIGVYAHDQDALAGYVWSEFGIQCTECLRMADAPVRGATSADCCFEELALPARLARMDELLCLWRLLADHLRQSPVFYAGREFTDESFRSYLSQPETRLFVVQQGGELVGMMDARPEAPFFTGEEGMANVGDLYLSPMLRGKGLAQGLLDFACQRLCADCFSRLWVCHGTANPTALRFWDRYFENVTYTLTRQLDRDAVALRLANR